MSKPKVGDKFKMKKMDGSFIVCEIAEHQKQHKRFKVKTPKGFGIYVKETKFIDGTYKILKDNEVVEDGLWKFKDNGNYYSLEKVS